MAGPNIYVDTKVLDNGTWRRIVGGVARSMEPNGESETLAVEFIVQGSTKAEFITRIQSTEADFVKTGARIQFFTDTAESPLYDWSPADAAHPSTMTSVEWVQEESHTVYSARLRFYASAARYPATGAGGGAGPNNYFVYTGQTSEIRLTEEYNEDGTLTISASGHFAPTAANSGAPMTLTAVSTSSGFAKFTVTGTMPTYATGMRIIVAGTVAYNGTHIVSAISGQNFISKTLFGAGETPGAATVQVQSLTSGETNYLAARSTILQTYLGTGANGVPSGSTNRVLLHENLIHDGPEGNEVDFILTAGPQPYIPTALVDGGGANVTRGFDFQLAVSEPETWFSEAGPKPKLIAATGTFNVDKQVVSSTKLYSWYLASKDGFAARVAAEATVSSSGLKLMATVVGIDYTLNCVKFSNVYRSNWTGVVDYSREYSYNERLDYSGWSDADGYDVAQRPNRAVPKTCVVTTMRLGEGEADLTPPAPAESGYTYVEVAKDLQKKGPFITEFSNNVFFQHDVRTFVRFRFKAGGASSTTIQQVNPSV